MGYRRKISTTVSDATYAYLRSLIQRGKARSMADALDLSMRGLRRAEARARLAKDTAEYFHALPPQAAEEEHQLESALDLSADEMNYDAH